MILLFIAACIAIYVLTVKLCQEIGYAHDERTACKHPETTLSTTPQGSIRSDCKLCGEYVGEWRNVTPSAQESEDA